MLILLAASERSVSSDIIDTSLRKCVAVVALPPSLDGERAPAPSASPMDSIPAAEPKSESPENNDSPSAMSKPSEAAGTSSSPIVAGWMISTFYFSIESWFWGVLGSIFSIFGKGLL